MGHLKSTGSRDYDCRRKQKSSLKAAKALPEIVRGKRKDWRKGSFKVQDPDELLKKTVDEESSLGILRFCHQWTTREIREVQRLFKEEIKEKTITLPTVREKIQGNIYLSKLLAIQVRDKIQSMIQSGNKGKLSLPDVTEDAKKRVAGFIQTSDFNGESSNEEPDSHRECIKKNDQEELEEGCGSILPLSTTGTSITCFCQ